jgi:hypothetical protein
LVGTERTRTHVHSERTAGFSTVGEAWALKQLQTDSVSRGLSISLFTPETILLSISVMLFFFIKRTVLEWRMIEEAAQKCIRELRLEEPYAKAKEVYVTIKFANEIVLGLRSRLRLGV